MVFIRNSYLSNENQIEYYEIMYLYPIFENINLLYFINFYSKLFLFGFVLNIFWMQSILLKVANNLKKKIIIKNY